MHKHLKRWIALGLAAVCLALCAFETTQAGDTLQYLMPPPAWLQSGEDGKTPAGQPLKDTWKQLEAAAEGWNGIISAYTLTGIAEKATFSGGGGTQEGRLECLGPNDQAVYPKFLRYGRLFYPEELEKGRNVILLDEQLALKLFKVVDAVDQTVNVKGQDYTVIGILRHEKQVGDLEEFGGYIPLMALVETPIDLTALMVSAQPIPGTGAGTTFAMAMGSWEKGTLWDLGKEAMGARIWLRVLLFMTGLTLVLKVIGWLNRRVAAFGADYKSRLTRQYAVRLLPRLTGFLLLFALGYGAAALAGAGLVGYIVKPVYTFPEWVPELLVEWTDIAAAFWNVWQKPAATLEYRSRQVLRLRFLAFLIQWLTALTGVLLTLAGRDLRLRKE